MKHLLYIALIIIGLAACNRRPDNVLSSSKMEKVLYDYHLAQAMISNIHGDSVSLKGQHYIDAVFDKHNITKEDFDSSIIYYNRHADKLKKIYDHLDDKFAKANEETQFETGNNDMVLVFSTTGDTANIWTGNSLIMLRSKNTHSTESFTLYADTSFHKHDQFILTLNPSFFKESLDDRDITLNIALSIHHKNGEVTSLTRQIANSGRQQYTLKTKEDSEIKSVTGHFYYYGKDNRRNFCVIDNIALIRIHEKDSKSEKMPESEMMKDSIFEDTLTNSEPTKRLTPEEMRLQNKTEKTLRIEHAPAVRTPNTLGPRRRVVK